MDVNFCKTCEEQEIFSNFENTPVNSMKAFKNYFNEHLQVLRIIKSLNDSFIFLIMKYKLENKNYIPKNVKIIEYEYK